jgi:hypothetical protein
MSRLSAHETWNTRFRKKVKALSALALVTGDVIFRPPPGTTFKLMTAIYKKRTITGTVSDDPNAKLTNGTTDLVAAVDIVNTNAYQNLVVVANNAVITHDAPLTLVISDAPAGATVWTYDLILEVLKLSD